jgi:glycosyltransferase involved in cell wall biosynthesis
MRVLIVGINYRPELTGIGPYTTGLAEHLVGRDDDVTVITGLPHYPAWRIAAGTRRSLLAEESLAGVRVIRAAHYVPARQDAGRRAVYEATFGATGLFASFRAEQPNAIVGIVPSLSGGLLARLLSRRFGAPYGVLFQDLMGPAARQSGITGGGLVANLTTAAERWVARGARSVGVVATSFAPYIGSLGVRPDRIVHVPNWTRVTTASLPVSAVRQLFGWADDLQVVLHAGNMGLKQGLGQVVDAARLAERRGDPVRFVLSGGGSQEEDVKAASADLSNIGFLGLQPDEMHASLLASADVLLLSERSAQLDMSLPSKLTAYYAAGRPIVAAVRVDGASAAEVDRSRAGIVVPAGRPAALLDALARLRSEPDLAGRLAAAGPAYAEAHTSPRACLVQGAAFVDRIAA